MWEREREREREREDLSHNLNCKRQLHCLQLGAFCTLTLWSSWNIYHSSIWRSLFLHWCSRAPASCQWGVFGVWWRSSQHGKVCYPHAENLEANDLRPEHLSPQGCTRHSPHHQKIPRCQVWVPGGYCDCFILDLVHPFPIKETRESKGKKLLVLCTDYSATVERMGGSGVEEKLTWVLLSNKMRLRENFHQYDRARLCSFWGEGGVGKRDRFYCCKAHNVLKCFFLEEVKNI